MSSWLFLAAWLALAGDGDVPTPVTLGGLLAEPQRYDGMLLEVSGEAQSALEGHRCLIGPGYWQSLSFDDLVLLYFPEPLGKAAKAGLRRLDQAHRKAEHVWVTVVGRFRVCDGQCVPGDPPTFRFELAATRIVKVTASTRPYMPSKVPSWNEQ